MYFPSLSFRRMSLIFVFLCTLILTGSKLSSAVAQTTQGSDSLRAMQSQIRSKTHTTSKQDKKKKKRKKKKEKRTVVKNPQPVPEFTVPDRIEGEKYVYFMAIGDQGTGEDGQHKVAQLMNEKARKDSLHFVLTLGDNIYDDGVKSAYDPQWQTKFVDVYDLEHLDVIFYATLGNHDHHKNRAPFQVAYTKVNPQWHMPAPYYTFTKEIDAGHKIQFFALDTTPWISKKAARLEQWRWLEQELQQSDATWKIVFAHHPVFSYGKHGHEKNLILELRPLLEKYGVDLYINGHDHDRQLLQPVGGVHYMTSGSGAKSRDTEYGPLTIFTETNLGFAYFRVSASQMHIQFINGNGKIEFAYTWEKGTIEGIPFVDSKIGGKKKNKVKKKRKRN